MNKEQCDLLEKENVKLKTQYKTANSKFQEGLFDDKLRTLWNELQVCEVYLRRLWNQVHELKVKKAEIEEQMETKHKEREECESFVRKEKAYKEK